MIDEHKSIKQRVYSGKWKKTLYLVISYNKEKREFNMMPGNKSNEVIYTSYVVIQY